MKISLSTVLALLVLGCNHVNPPIQGRQDPYSPSQMHFDSEQLRRDTAIGTPVATRDESGILHVDVPIRSAINKTLYVDYRVTWLDRNGQSINRLGPFTKTLEPNTPDSIQVNSTTPRAADYQIDFRYAK
jgi:uncharacterized protein YcfL